MKTKKPGVKKKPVPATSGDWTVGVYVDNDFEPSYFPVEVDARDAAGFKKDICPLIAKSTYGDRPSSAIRADSGRRAERKQ